ncbi:hypothetical protein [Kitasatospora griseola]|uniref:hypothetical protein n=1 Tax=Kitasatospora griseola TaxID=2064 RepID=UPI0007C6A54C|nr:hypothetical protein [Kitasatospora griseola]
MATADWVRATYRVPAKRGGRVAYTGDPTKGRQHGTITSFRGPYVRIRLDGEKRAVPFHPTWELEYLPRAAWTLTADNLWTVLDETDRLGLYYAKPHYAPAPADAAVPLSTVIDGLTIRQRRDGERAVVHFGDRIVLDMLGVWSVERADEQQPAPELAALRQLSDAEITAELAPLATVIDRVLHITPVRLGNTADLTAALTLAVAVYMGPLVGDVPEQLAALREQLAAVEAENQRLRGDLAVAEGARDAAAAAAHQAIYHHGNLGPCPYPNTCPAAWAAPTQCGPACSEQHTYDGCCQLGPTPTEDCQLPSATCTRRQCTQAASLPTT